jgi:hypothetical protein
MSSLYWWAFCSTSFIVLLLEKMVTAVVLGDLKLAEASVHCHDCSTGFGPAQPNYRADWLPWHAYLCIESPARPALPARTLPVVFLLRLSAMQAPILLSTPEFRGSAHQFQHTSLRTFWGCSQNTRAPTVLLFLPNFSLQPVPSFSHLLTLRLELCNPASTISASEFLVRHSAVIPSLVTMPFHVQITKIQAGASYSCTHGNEFCRPHLTAVMGLAVQG